MKQSICSVDGCDRRKHSRSMCSMHYNRVRRHGDPNHVERKPNVGNCSVDGCDKPMRKREWCANHYSMWHAHGEIRDWQFKWADARDSCLECGGAMGDYKSRTYCSEACKARGLRHGGKRPESYECVRCGVDVPLSRVGQGGRVKRADSKLCTACRRENKFGMNVRELAQRDGTDCRICGEVVDMGLKRPESLFGPSVDHVIPRAHGGSDDPENLQLAHYWCNAAKSDREGFVIT